MSKAINYSETYHVVLGTASKQAIATAMEAELAAAIEADLGLTAGAATAVKMMKYSRGITIQKNDDGDYVMSIHMDLPAQVSVPDPE